MRSFDEVDRMTVLEYELLMKAVRLKAVDDDFRVHELAYLGREIQATKGQRSPKPVYRTFHSFYDYENELKKAEAADKPKKNRFSELSKAIQRKEREKGE